MRDATRNVLQFQIATGEPIPNAPTIPEDWQRRLKADLVFEEFKELMTGCGYALYAPDDADPQKIAMYDIQSCSLPLTADAIVDLIYVVIGLANAWGIPTVAVWDAVHKANMAKRMLDGSFKRRADGKILKPDDWKPADIEAILAEATKRYVDRTGMLNAYE